MKCFTGSARSALRLSGGQLHGKPLAAVDTSEEP